MTIGHQGRAPDRLGAAARAAMLVAALLGPLMLLGSILMFGRSQSHGGQVGIALTLAGWPVLAVSMAVAGVLVLVWLARARAAVDAVSPVPQRLSAGWVVGAWFVPVGCLWLPARAVSDLVRAADPAYLGGGAQLDLATPVPGVARWWGSWIGAWVLFWAGWIALVALTGGRMVTAPLTLLVLVLELGSTACLVLAAVTFGALLRRVSAAVGPAVAVYGAGAPR